MKNRVLFVLAIIGVLAGLVAAYLFGRTPHALPPAVAPASSPYETPFMPMASSKASSPVAPTS